MPDISMCDNISCPLKETCYRFKATPNPYRQAYADFKYDEVKKECNHYWEMESIDKKIKK